MSRICAVDDVPEGGARGFRLDPDDPGSLRVIVVRHGGGVRVYRNRCPHRGTPLDWVPDRFLDGAGEHLVCATHGALFRIEDGHCVAGPCAGDALERLSSVVEDGEVRTPDPQVG
jgi:nitrite reductase/ring-hydroxylating ferredoxin subunit